MPGWLVWDYEDRKRWIQLDASIRPQRLMHIWVGPPIIRWLDWSGGGGYIKSDEPVICNGRLGGRR